MQNEQAFHSLSEKSSNVLVFLEVDVDDSPGVASQCEAKYMPTFQFFKKGQKVSEFSFLFLSSLSFFLFFPSFLHVRPHDPSAFSFWGQTREGFLSPGSTWWQGDSGPEEGWGILN